MWQIIGASTKGTSHIQNGFPCQDAHTYCILNEDIAFCAVADGLGSASQADKGALLAVETASDVFKSTISKDVPSNTDEWTELLHNVFAGCRQAVIDTAKHHNLNIQEFATTLLVLVLTTEWMAIGHLGDGAVVALLTDGSTKTISSPQRGEYVNETIPLTATDALSLVNYFVQQSQVECAALLTDGLQNLSINTATGSPYIPFFKPFFDAIPHLTDPKKESEQLAEFLDSARVCSRTEDDKTLVIIGKTSGQIPYQRN